MMLFASIQNIKDVTRMDNTKSKTIRLMRIVWKKLRDITELVEMKDE